MAQMILQCQQSVYGNESKTQDQFDHEQRLHVFLPHEASMRGLPTRHNMKRKPRIFLYGGAGVWTLSPGRETKLGFRMLSLDRRYRLEPTCREN